MTEELLEAGEAAKILGVAVCTLTRLKKDRLLPCVRLNGKIRYPRRAVEELRQERSQGFTARTIRAEQAHLRYRVSKLEEMVSYIMAKTKLDEKKWHFTDRDLLIFYTKCNSVPSHLEASYVREWLEVALYIGELEYDKLAALTGDLHPWVKVFGYIDELVEALKRKRHYYRDIELQQLVTHLVAAQLNLRKQAVNILEARPITMPATERFSLLVSKGDAPIDINEMRKRALLPNKAGKKDVAKLNRLIEESREGPKNPPEEKEEN